MSAEAITQAHVQRVIDDNLDALRRPGVLSVRPGFRMRDHWLTHERAVVVTVAPGTARTAAGLPAELHGVPLDVREASAAKVARLGAGEDAVGLAPDQGGVPVFADERVFVTAAAHAQGSEHPEAAKKPAKPQLEYSAPAGATLTPVTGTVQLELSASPDSGWSVLKTFLQGTKESLTIGLYDFTSAHILQEFETIAAGKKVTLVLDHPAKNPTADQTDDQTVADLESTLGASFDHAWALERSDPHATAWIFPSAYHIKVAVRDSDTVWLSSGNWNNSNQPDIDPVNNPDDRTEARSRDRDWHVVIHDAALAKQFEAYLLHDHEVAAQHQVSEAAAFETELLMQPAVETPPFATFAASESVDEHLTITPLLTPDPGVYSGAMLELIQGATTSLHLQFQYIEPPKTPTDASAPFSELIAAIVARQNAGVDVKVIMSEYETSGYLEQLQELGLDVVNNVKIQNNVHNKGVVVDGVRTLVSSQNWSTAGALQNRDAGVIIDDEHVAQYFGAIFLHDWDHLAVQKAQND